MENKRTLKTMLASKRVVSDYKKYLSWRGLLQITSGRRRPPLPTPSASALWRERDKNLRLFASKCNHCGYIQFPPQRVCYNCQTKDNFSNYRIAGHKATLYTYSLDYVTPSGNQPVVNSVIDFEGGGRMFVQMTDHEVSQLKVGIPLDLNFRKLYTSEGIPNYFWKASPQRFQ